jgi:putative ATP-binding cassette transporter
MLSLLKEELPDATIVSIAHRPGTEAFHQRTMGLVKSSGGAKLITKRREREKATKLQPSLHKRLMSRLRRRHGAAPGHPAPQGRGHR